MRIRLLTAAFALVLAACASTSGAVAADEKKTAKPTEPVMEKMAVVNSLNFDLAACGPKAAEAYSAYALNDTLLTATLLSGRPMYQECLIDPKTRGAAADTQVVIKATVSDTEVKYDVSSTNLEPGGKACIEKALASLPVKPLEKGAKAIEAQVPFNHSGATQGLKWGVNLASDVVGTVRAAQTSWCDCYAEIGTKPPPSIEASLHVQPEKPLEVTMKAAEADAKISSCLEAKLKAATLPKAEREVTLTYRFLLLNSNAQQENAEAIPNLQFLQLDAIRQGKEVDVAFGFGARQTASNDFENSVKKYKAKPSSALMKELREKCAGILTRDDGWRGSLDALKQTYERTQKLVATLKAKDAAWEAVDSALGERLAVTTKELGAAEEQKKNDTNTCKKLQ